MNKFAKSNYELHHAVH